MKRNVTVEVPRSGHREQFTNQLTSKVGTITPIFVEEVLPSQKTRLEMAIKCSLPPLAADTFMNVKLKVESIFVPMRLLCASFESWFTDVSVPVLSRYDGAEGQVNEIDDAAGGLPYFHIDDLSDQLAQGLLSSFLSHSTLADYLGYKFVKGDSVFDAGRLDIGLMPFLAYHRIWDDLYRDSRITKSCFARLSHLSSYAEDDGLSYPLAAAPFTFFIYPSGLSQDRNFFMPAEIEILSDNDSDELYALADDVPIYSLRQRNYGFDYFTVAMPTPQLGQARSVNVAVSGSSGSFTIASLRTDNAIQQFRDRNGLAGEQFTDVNKNRYGADLSFGVAQRAICIGACDYDVYTDGVTNNQQSTPTESNPLSGFGGSRSGVAYAQGHDLIIDDFVSNEPGYIFVMATLVPKAQYRAGIRRYLDHYIGPGSLTDMADPILQQVGPQPIYKWELDSHYIKSSAVFGFTDRYAEFYSHENEIHGLFREGESLENFVSARDDIPYGSGNKTEINTDFLEIPTTALDNVTAANAALSEYGYQLQVAFDCQKILPLSEYVLPSLQDPAYEHGKKLSILRGGFHL